MKLLVCVSKTPETTAKISFNSDLSEFNKDGVQFIMNPYDEWYALVRALELKEQVGTGEVVVITVGDASNDPILRKGLAIGADSAVRVDGSPQSALYAATQIASYAKDKDFDIIFCGKETIDYSSAQTGGMVAEHLGLPFVSFSSSMEVSDGVATINRDIEGGVEVVKVSTPFVLSAAKGMAEQRIPNMRGIMTAKRKPLDVVEAVAVDESVTIARYEYPESKSGVQMIDPENMDELVRLLHEEAKVI